MRLNASRPRNAILRDSGSILPALVLALAALLAGMHVQAQAPAASQPAKAQRAPTQVPQPNAAPTAAMAPAAAVVAGSDVVPVLQQNLPQDPLRIAIQNAIQKGMQEAKQNPPATQAKQPAAGNTAPSGPSSASPPSNGSPAVNGAANPNQPAAATLMCQGTRPNGSAFTLLFDPNASPAPAAGDACIPTGQKMAKGSAVMSTSPKTGPLLAVVVVPSTPAGGANKIAAAPASTELVCKGTRVNGAAFTFAFAANISPAPTLGAACAPSGKTMPKGTAVMGTAPKAGTVFAAVLVAQNAVPNTPAATPTAAAHIGPPAVNRAANPVAAPAGPVPPLINAGIQALVSSKASLEIAGSKWGGHKEPAIKLIDQALAACGQTATPDNAAAKANPAGDTAAMEAALAQLTKAQTNFKNAKDAWGGRRDQALPLITQALSDVQAGIAFAKSHNTY